MSLADGLAVTPITGLGEIRGGDDLAALLAERLAHARDGDVVAVAQKIVSKAEGRMVRLDEVTPSSRALELAEATAKDPRLVELVLSESAEVVRAVAGLIIARHRLGFVLANAGIDRSNLTLAGQGDETQEQALLLPIDPDASAERLRAGLVGRLGVEVGVIITDSFGRSWRNGTVNVAIGAAGVTCLWDRRGELDRAGRVLQATEIAVADALAAAAGLVMGEGAEGCPAALVRMAPPPAPHQPASVLVRPLERDLFR